MRLHIRVAMLEGKGDKRRRNRVNIREFTVWIRSSKKRNKTDPHESLKLLVFSLSNILMNNEEANLKWNLDPDPGVYTLLSRTDLR